MGTQLQVAGAVDIALGNMWLGELESLHLIWIYNFFVKPIVYSFFSFNSG